VLNHDGLDYSLEFDIAAAQASNANQPFFVDFTGVNCLNCRLMERTALRKPAVHDVLKKLPRAQLYVDTIPGVEDEEASQRILERNHELQRWYGDVAIPAYAIVSPDGKEILSRFRGVDTSGQKFQDFLEEGLSEWRQRSQSVGTAVRTTGLITVR